MRMIKRWGVMTLVALLVLGTMGAALAEETVDSDEPTELAEPVTYPMDWAGNLVNFVFYWGFGEKAAPECDSGDTDTSGTSYLNPVPVVAETPCVPLMVEGPNGQVNHGTMVSAFVRLLKSGDAMTLLEGFEGFADMPRGQMVKEFAHLDFGKGFDDGEDPDDDDPELADEDGDGPPDHVLEKKADKAEKAKGPKK